jgi:hypothetical protein
MRLELAAVHDEVAESTAGQIHVRPRRASAGTIRLTELGVFDAYVVA